MSCQSFVFPVRKGYVRYPLLARILSHESAHQTVLADYELIDEERNAIESSDIGLLTVLGVNGQLLMHFAAMSGVAWPDYAQAMRDGVDRYGPVRAGLYAITDGKGAI